MARKTLAGAGATAVLLLAAGQARAWGDDGHKMVAWIAYGLLTPGARSKVDAMLAADTDTHLTAMDFGSRATWADKYRDEANRTLHYDQTQRWHFVDLDIHTPDLSKACFSFPATPAGTAASEGPKRDCVLDKIEDFQAELASPKTSDPERLMALKFLIHLVGDVHQPLHASEDGDNSGGNCEQVLMVANGRRMALHHYWDTETVDALVRADPVTTGPDRSASHPSDAALRTVADAWRLALTPAAVASYQSSDPKAWASASYKVATTVGYHLPAHAACGFGDDPKDYPAFLLPTTYQDAARKASRRQIERAGARLAGLINGALT
ncbi:S1/P1 nuclease [Phenylobacterium aquaticum]|uniref:S1/P1 nuclease n=1 Tax=Phenylobacterium aquaticum TaxID=1763816 RepID=UPI001F5CEC3A|nr:S1/P1 nuclease [Phenylobacterium aquaticum]MCI3132067.1 S1/P1 nuclease [Phenylobacterium aquaticum]